MKFSNEHAIVSFRYYIRCVYPKHTGNENRNVEQQQQRMELFKSVVVFCSNVLCVSIVPKAVKPLYIHAEKMEVSGMLLLDTAAG